MSINPASKLSREDARDIAIRAARDAKPRPSYFVEPFEPHEWVIDAIVKSHARGYNDGSCDASVGDAGVETDYLA